MRRIENIGIKLVADGEKQFKQALAEINQSFKVLGSEMKLVKSAFDENDTSVEALTARHEVLSKEVEAQKDKIATLRAALDNAASSFGENDKRTQSWQIQLNNAQAALNGMERELRDNETALGQASSGMVEATDEADKLGDEVEKSAKQADDAGGKFSKLGSVCKRIAAGITAAFVAVSAAAVAGGTALVSMSRDGADYADTVMTESTVTGIATDKLQEYMYAAELVDVSTDTLTNSMAKQIKSMKDVQDGTKLSVDAYQKLGVSVTDADGSLRDSDTVYWEVIDALGKVTNETERDALAMQILGKSAQDLNPIITAGAGRMAELGEEARKTGYVLTDETLSAYGAFDDELQRLNTGATAAKNALGTVLLPVLTDLAGEGVDLLNQFTTGIRDADGDVGKMTDIISGLIPQVVDSLMERLPDLLDFAGSVLGSLGQAFLDNLPGLVEPLASGLLAAVHGIADKVIPLLSAVLDTVMDMLPDIIRAGADIIVSLVKGIAKELPNLIPQIASVMVTVAQTIIDNLPQLLDSAILLVQSLADGILAALPILIDALPDVIVGIVDFLSESTPQMIDAGIKLLASIVQNIPAIVSSIARALPKIVVGIVDALVNLGKDLFTAGADFFSGLFSDPKGTLSAIWDYIKELAAGVVGGFSDGLREAWDSMSDVGRRLLEGLWQGILDAKDWIVEKVSGIGESILNGIKNVFDIHSPSRKMAWVGGMLMQGLAGGIDDTAKEVISSASDVTGRLNSVFDGLSADLSETLPGRIDIRTPNVSGAAASPAGVQIHLNIQTFNNYTRDDIEALTEEVMETAAGFMSRKEAVFA